MKSIKIIIFLIAINTFAQTKIKGLVVNINNKPIGFASIQLVEKETDLTQNYTSSNEKGEFSLPIPDNKKQYFLKIRLLGYKLKNIQLKNFNNLKIPLEERVEELKEIIINVDFKEFKVENDTITYKLNSITNKTERNLKDIVEKLPGLSIDENKKINYQGRKIEKVIIDGNDFFGKKHEMATENLSAEAIKGIKLLKNFKDFDDISSQKTGKIVLNVTLKKDYRNRIVGNIDGKSGLLEKYQAHSNLFKFVNKGNFALVSEANNIGEPAINLMDYIEMSGGIKNFVKSNRNNGTGTLEIDHSKTPRFVFVKNDTHTRKTFFNSINFTNQFSKRTKLTGYINFDKTDINELLTNRKTYVGENPFVINEHKVQNSTSYLGNSYVTLSHKINKNEVLTYNFKFNPLKDNYFKNINQNFNVSQKKENKLFFLGQNLAYKNQLKDDFYIELNLFYDIKNQKSTINYNANQPFLGLDFTNEPQLLNQGNDKLNNINLDISSFYNFSKKTELKSIVSFGSKINKIDLNSNHNKFDLNLKGVKNQFGFYNKLYHKFNWNFSTEIGLNYINNSLNINNLRTNQNWALPDLLLSYQLKNNQSLNFNFLQKNKNCSIYQSNLVQLISNYNTIINPNIDIFTPIEDTVFGLNYNAYSYTRSTTFDIMANYTITKNAISYNTVVKENYIEKNYERVPSHSFMIKSKYNSSIKSLKYRFSAEFVKTKTYSYFNTKKSMNDLFSYSTRLILNLDRKSFANTRINLFYNRNVSKNEFSELDYSINNFYVIPEVYGKYNNLLWSLSYKYTKIKSGFKNQEINDLKFSLQWKFSRNIELFLKGNNILNLKNNPRITYRSDNSYSQFTKLEQLKGSLLVGMRYHF
ncbi:carboxypeptidase-like regulatory domain-containing protein [Tenacibaculum salmonis]|uniref:carboxypeptidase-like regulatory domain-containing protein n=1 Tax=Tenacibaculum sp. P3-BQ1 TaxID=3232310 RepID=UPI0034DEB357